MTTCRPLPPPAACLLAALLAVPVTAAMAGEEAAGNDVVPVAEQSGVDLAATGGPTETRGVLSTDVLGALDLAQDFPQMDGYRMRARVVTLDAGGRIAVHQHDARPAVAYLLEGEVTEVRPGRGETDYTPGKAVFEQTGTVHWWENRSESAATVLVVDIVPKD